MEKKKNFKLFDAVLASVCIILVVEATAPASSIGNSQYFWWAFLLIAFFLPYGLVSAELGTTYEDEGGLFEWVKRAYGVSWGSRVAWYYWINYPIWVASLAVLFTEVIEQIFFINLSLSTHIFIQLIFIWLICILSLLPISENKTLINIGTFSKIFLMISLGILGIFTAMVFGFANPITSSSDLLPSLDGIPFISVILFNFMGFEIVTTFASEMENPKKDIPKAILLGGLCIALIYIFASIGISSAIPIEELSTSGGMIDSFVYFFDTIGFTNKIFIIIIGLMFMYTLIVNPVSWAIGINYVVKYAAEDNAMPKIFAKETKNKAPIGASIVNGIVATILVIVAPFSPNENMFWSFFALQVITLLMSYIVMFPAFKKLRMVDKDVDRPFKVPGNKFVINIITYVPCVLLILSAIFSMIYPNGDGTWTFDIVLITGTIFAIIIGEIIVFTSNKKQSKSKGDLYEKTK